MQGRLTKPIHRPIQEFPMENWENELEDLKSLGLNNIEWVLDKKTKNGNPILINNSYVKKALDRNNIQCTVLTNDYYLDLVNEKLNYSYKNIIGALNLQDEIFDNLRNSNINLIVIPLLENSSLKELNNSEINNVLKKLSDLTELSKINIALELDLEPKKISDILNDSHKNLSINYDMGNSTFFNFEYNFEFENYFEHITNVHIKDGKIGGGTVPLGEGDTNFNEIINTLIDLGYKSNFTMQIARNGNDEIATIKQYIEKLINE